MEMICILLEVANININVKDEGYTPLGAGTLEKNVYSQDSLYSELNCYTLAPIYPFYRALCSLL